MKLNKWLYYFMFLTTLGIYEGGLESKWTLGGNQQFWTHFPFLDKLLVRSNCNFIIYTSKNLELGDPLS